MIKKNKGISIINDKLGRVTTTAVSQLQWSQPLFGMQSSNYTVHQIH